MNLLPDTEKNILKKGLKLRFFVVVMFLLAIFFLVGFIMLLPSYFLTLGHFSRTVQENYLSKVKNGDPIQKILDLPAEIDSKLKFFQSNANHTSMEDLLSEIITYKPEKVRLNSISFTKNRIYKEKNGTVVLISGIADNRDSLVSFLASLRESSTFSSVDMPVSGLTKDQNPPFSVNIFIEN